MNPALITCIILSCYLAISVNCISPDECKLPYKVGPCRGLFKAYYFNPSSNQCEEFFYGGCDGNANRFKTEVECNEQCANKNTRNG